MEPDEHPYIGTLEEDMDAEGAILEEEAKLDAIKAGLCANCLDHAYVKQINGVKLCAMCAARYPSGMPF